MNTNSSQTEKPAPKPEDIEGVVTITVTSSKLSILNMDGTFSDREYLARSYSVATGKAYKVPVYRIKVTSTARPGEEKWRATLRFMPSKRNSAEAVFMSGLADAQNYAEPAYDPKYNPHNTPNLDIGAFHLYDDFLLHAGPDSLEEDDYGLGGLGCVEVFEFAKLQLDIVYMCGKHPSDLPNNTMAYLCKNKRINIVIEKTPLPPVVEIDPPLHLMHKFQ